MFVYTRTEHRRITTQISTKEFISWYLFLRLEETLSLFNIYSLLFCFHIHRPFPLRFLITTYRITTTATTMFAKVKEFFQSDYFDARWKGKVFAAQVGVTLLAFILGIAKLATRPSNIPMSRMDIMAITMVSSSGIMMHKFGLTDLK